MLCSSSFLSQGVALAMLWRLLLTVREGQQWKHKACSGIRLLRRLGSAALGWEGGPENTSDLPVLGRSSAPSASPWQSPRLWCGWRGCTSTHCPSHPHRTRILLLWEQKKKLGNECGEVCCAIKPLSLQESCRIPMQGDASQQNSLTGTKIPIYLALKELI